MRNAEDTAAKLVFQFLDTRDPFTIVFNLIIVVLLPAFGEELLFRGVIQPTIGLWTRNQHLAVWATAFLFSAMHMQFFTFLPRFLLGGMLGYLLVYGKSIWYPIAGHFLNNFLSLTIFYYYRRFKPELNPMDAENGNYSIWTVIISLIFIVGIFLFIQKRTKLELNTKAENFQD
jgi:membrane protease YdiL (CAAX protease family)